jgi:hypothetical protein
MKNARGGRDATLREFKERDLGSDIASAATAVIVRSQRPTSILLGDELKAALRKRGQELGVGYQTAAKLCLFGCEVEEDYKEHTGRLSSRVWTAFASASRGSRRGMRNGHRALGQPAHVDDRALTRVRPLRQVEANRIVAPGGATDLDKASEQRRAQVRIVEHRLDEL